MAHPWMPNLGREDEMLKAIGVDAVDALFSDIPEELRLKRCLRVGAEHMLSEDEVYRVAAERASSTRGMGDLLVFRGGGVWPHYVPAAVKAIVSRGEFYTSYTPYQPEISQGLLQALFEYQSLMADLLEMDVVNASMYDWSTALAEAVLMSLRITHRRKVLVPSTMNPQHLAVLRTITALKGVKVVRVGYDRETGLMDLRDLHSKVDSETAAVYIENPSYLGFIETQVDEIADEAHRVGALLIAGVDPISLGLLRPPGDYGADIAVGEAQPLGLGMNYGGPLLGIFAVRGDYRVVRQMPGRLIGMTTTLDGRQRGFTMILQTREQHIRREKATSNICTNEALCAVAAAVYLSLLGPRGLRELGEEIVARSHYAASRINALGGFKAPLFESEFFKEFVVGLPPHLTAGEVDRGLLERGIVGGKPLTGEFPELGESMLFCVTEVHSKEDIDRLVKALGEVAGHV